MAFGSTSFAHQHVYDSGISPLGRLHPGHLHCLAGGSSPSCNCWRFCCVDPSFLAHFFTHDRWKTVQQVLHDHTFEFLSTSLVQIGHSYKPCKMSSCVRVAISTACDFENRRCLPMLGGGWLWVAEVLGTTVWPGVNAGASACSDKGAVLPFAWAPPADVSFPPNARPPAPPITCLGAPPLWPGLPPLPRFDCPLFLLFGFGAVCGATGTGGTAVAFPWVGGAGVSRGAPETGAVPFCAPPRRGRL